MGNFLGIMPKKQSSVERVNEIRAKTSYRRSFTDITIAIGDVVHFDMKVLFPDALIWLPFNKLRITNSSACDLDIAYNDLTPQNIRRVPAGTIRDIKGFYFSRLTIYNLSGASAVAPPQVQIEVGKE